MTTPGATVACPARTCPVCASGGQEEVFGPPAEVPAFCNWLYDDVPSARAATTGEVRLVVCRGCGHLFNAAHDEALLTYGAGYENSLHFSATFQDYAVGLAVRLLEQYHLHGGTVLEVGSGKGDFLAILVEQGMARALGYDPSYAGEQEGRVTDGRITFVPSLFPDHLGDLDLDLICARHVLEHLERPRELMSTLRPALGSDRRTVLYAEVPDGGHLLRETALWDLIYEHPSHFTAPSLHRLLSDGGLPVAALGTSFGGQYLWAEATSRPEAARVPTEPVGAVLDAAAGFRSRAEATLAHWTDELARAAASGQQVVLWGGGSKGVTFLNLVPGADVVERVVDINPRKHGRHVPGTAQRVVGPQDLVQAPPDVVVVLNPLYVSEVRTELDRLGVSAEVCAAETSSATR